MSSPPPRLGVVCALLLFAGCSTTSRTTSHRVSDAPVSLTHVAVMADVPDADLRRGFHERLERLLAERDLRVSVLEPSRDPRPERIAAAGADAGASAVLRVGTTSSASFGDDFSYTDNLGFDRKTGARQDYRVAFTLYSVDGERRAWTGETETTTRGGAADARYGIGERLASIVVQAMEKDGLL